MAGAAAPRSPLVSVAWGLGRLAACAQGDLAQEERRQEAHAQERRADEKSMGDGVGEAHAERVQDLLSQRVAGWAEGGELAPQLGHSTWRQQDLRMTQLGDPLG